MTNRDRVKQLIVSTPQGVAGSLTKEAQHVFNYTGKDQASEVSLTMPLRQQSYSTALMLPVFAMNLPEGHLLQYITKKLAKVGKVDDMKLLEATGAHQIGRLRFHLPGENGTLLGPQIGLQRLIKDEHSEELFKYLLNSYFDVAVAGVQPKVLLPDADRLSKAWPRSVPSPELIVKTSGEHPELTQNEYLCMDAARRAGIEVPNFWLSDNGQLFIIERFDLKDGRALGFEDMPVLMGKIRDQYGSYKYEGSYEQIAKAIRLHCPDADSLQRYYEYVALSVMARNGDAHLKNFGVLYDHPHSESEPPRLAPLFDVCTTTIYEFVNREGLSLADREMALKMAKSRLYPTREELLNFGRVYCNVGYPADVLDRITEGMLASLKANKDRMNREMAGKLSKEWDGGMRSMSPSMSYPSRPSLTPPRQRAQRAVASPVPDERSAVSRYRKERLARAQRVFDQALGTFMRANPRAGKEIESHALRTGESLALSAQHALFSHGNQDTKELLLRNHYAAAPLIRAHDELMRVQRLGNVEPPTPAVTPPSPAIEDDTPAPSP